MEINLIKISLTFIFNLFLIHNVLDLQDIENIYRFDLCFLRIEYNENNLTMER